MNEADFVALLVFIVPMCFTPGPNNLLCAAHGSQHGFRATIPMTLGMLVGWSSLGVAVGLGTVYIEDNKDITLSTITNIDKAIFRMSLIIIYENTILMRI